MNKRAVWSLVVGAAVALGAVVAIAVSSSGDDSPSAATTPTPAASQPVTAPSTTPAPAGGTATPTPAPTAPPKPSKPVGLDKSAPIVNGAEARVEKITSVKSVAETPGEISGPAIQVTMRITAGDKRVNLNDVVVNGYYGSDLTPAISVMKPGGKPFKGTLSAGDKATGVYVFNVPANQRGDVTFELFFSATEAPALFTGSAR